MPTYMHCKRKLGKEYDCTSVSKKQEHEKAYLLYIPLMELGLLGYSLSAHPEVCGCEGWIMRQIVRPGDEKTNGNMT